MKAAAWLLTLADGIHVAVGERELAYILSDEVQRVSVPCAPEYAHELIVWQNRLLPLFNVVAALRDRDAASETAADQKMIGGSIILIAAYQVSTGSQVEYGALTVCALPERIEVAEDSGCELPSAPAGWRRLAHSCCQHQPHGAVPILDLQRMFAPDEHLANLAERRVQQ